MLDEKEIRNTLIAYANGKMRRYAAAKTLYLSVSTLEYRLQKIKKVTGLDPKNFFDLVKLLDITKERRK